MNKRILLGLVISISFLSAGSIDCKSKPLGSDLSKSIDAGKIKQAKKQLKEFKSDIKAYLSKCDKSKVAFEETSVIIMTYKAQIEDKEYDLKNKVNVDCSIVPKPNILEEAFAKKDPAKIKGIYSTYSKNAKDYLDNCAAHEDYEFVFEESLLQDEIYTEWVATNK